MYIAVDPQSSVPLYQQVKDHLRLAAATGALRPGDQLPTVRDLAARLLLNPNTVARAYRDLQTEGLLSSRQGSGTFVATDAPTLTPADRRHLVAAELHRAAALAQSLGLSAAEFSGLAREAHAQAAPTPAEVDDHVRTRD